MPKTEDQWKKIFIGGLTSTTTDESLKEFFSQWGEVVDCIVMKDPATKRSRGFGFVTFSEAEAVDQAMANRPHELDGKVVESKRAIPRDPSGKSETNISVKRLYVSGVREEHTDEMLRDHFGQYGNVQEVDIIADKTTGKKRGFAFVTFDDYDAVDKCVLQKSHMIDDKRCDVKKALSKEEMAKAEATRERLERDGRSRGMARGDGGWNQGGGGGSGGWGYGGGAGASAAWNSGGSGSGGGSGGWGAGGGYGGDGGYGGGYGNPMGGAGGWGGQPDAAPWIGQRGGSSWGQGGARSDSWQGGQQRGGWGQRGGRGSYR